MEQQFEILTATRNNVLKAIDGLSLEQLNTIPPGYRNNIIWNVGHIVATQQLICYKLAKQEMKLDGEFVDRYKKGTEASLGVDQDEVDLIKEMLIGLPIIFAKDYENQVFKEYTEYTTSYNVSLKSIEDGLQFNNVHEGLHLGYIMALKKIV